MALEITRTIVIGALCIFFFAGWMLATIQNLNLKDEIKAYKKANRCLYEQNIELKLKSNFMSFLGSEKETNKKVGKK